MLRRQVLDLRIDDALSEIHSKSKYSIGTILIKNVSETSFGHNSGACYVELSWFT